MRLGSDPRKHAFLQVLYADHPLFASRAQGECNKLSPGELLASSDRFLFLTHPPKLKKSINRVVQELTFLGFSPEVVRDLTKQGHDVLHEMREKQGPDEQIAPVNQSHTTTSPSRRLLYEVDNGLGHLLPRLRLIIETDTGTDTAVREVLTWEVTPNVPILISQEDSLADS